MKDEDRVKPVKHSASLFMSAGIGERHPAVAVVLPLCRHAAGLARAERGMPERGAKVAGDAGQGAE